MVINPSGIVITSGKIKQIEDSKIEDYKIKYPKLEVFFKKQRPDHNYNKTLELCWKNPDYLSHVKS